MKEMLREIEYEDIGAIDLFVDGATLAGEAEPNPMFKQRLKPVMVTLDQLCRDAHRRNQVVLNFARSSGDDELGRIMLNETLDEIEHGWLEGPFRLQEDGAPYRGGLAPTRSQDSLNRRFQCQCGERLMCFSWQDRTSPCGHLTALVRSLVMQGKLRGVDCSLQGKTYDLKSAYRQVPIHPAHCKFGYISLYNHELGEAQIYRLKTLRFGATHSVYCFLRLARTIYAVATLGLKLLTANFYDDFILASEPGLVDSSKNAMELLLLLAGWDYAKTGKKALEFGTLCRALGVEFNFSRSVDHILMVDNTQSRKDELVTMIFEASFCVESLGWQIHSCMAGWAHCCSSDSANMPMEGRVSLTETVLSWPCKWLAACRMASQGQ